MKNISHIFIISLFLNFSWIKIITSQYTLNHCENGNREIILNNETYLSLPCIDCPEGEYTYYNEKIKSFKCEKCKEGSSNYKNDILINNFLKDDLLSKYSYESFCYAKNDLCPKWTKNYFSIKVNYIESLSYKSFFSIKQYFMNNGELIIKYINYNGGIDKLFNVYVNGKLSFTDDTNNNILNIKYIEVKKGENIFTFEYLVNEEIRQSIGGFVEIFEIILKNAEISALNCEKYDLIEKLNDNILNRCEYNVSKCNLNEDYCTYRFYSEVKNDYCIKQFDSFYQEIEYKKIQNANCMEISIPPSQNSLCEYCSYGQYSNIINGTNKECKYCQNYYYNSKEINEEYSCKEICETENKQLIKILYINNFDNPSNYNIDNIEITQPIGYIVINYEKFNEKINTIFYIEIVSVSTLKLIDPNNNEINLNYYSFSIPIVYGKHSLKIKGSNLKLNKIIIKGSSEGGNYKCIDKINITEEIKCGNNDEYYSLLQNKCMNCPLGTIIDKNKKCGIYTQFINDIYTLDNNEINLNFFSNIYELDNEDIKYYLNINPTNPLIYLKNNTSNNINDKPKIIGKELKNIKTVKGINERGIILTFISEKDNSYVYMKCNPYLSEIHNFELYLKNISIENEGKENITNYYFIIESNSSCPYCLTSEVNFESSDSKCINGKKKENVLIKNNSLCVIKSFENEEKLKLKDNKNILLNINTTDSEGLKIIKNFEINEEIPIKYEHKDDNIIISYEKEIECENKDDKKLFIIFFILFFFVILIVLGLIGVVIWKIIDNKNKKNRDINSGERITELSVITSKD